MKMQNNNCSSKVTKAIIAGVVIGMTGIVTLLCCCKKPEKRTLGTKAASAIDTVSMFMENLADMMR